MPQQLSYLQVVDNRGRAVVEPGIVRTDQVDALGLEQPLRGRGLRLYHAESTASGLTFGALSVLIFNMQRALRDVVAKLASAPAHHYATAPLRLRAKGGRSCFASLDLSKDKLEFFEPGADRSLEEFIANWARAKSYSHLLLELNASAEVLRTLERHIAEEVARIQTPTGNKAQPAKKVASNLPPDTVAAAQRRSALARDWLDGAAVNDLLGSTATNKSQLPTRLRQEGKILGVWVVADNRYRFPTWQFNQNQLIPEFREILSLLRSERGVAGGRQTSGWEEIEWLCAPHALLAKQIPADLLATTPERVLEAARQEFMENQDAGW